MARTLEIGGLTSGKTLTVDVTPFDSDVLTENIALTEKTNAKTVYTGTIATASGAVYRLGIKEGAAYIGAGEVQIDATDAVTYHARDTANSLQWNGLTTVALPLTPTTAGRSLNVTAGGLADADVMAINRSTLAATITAAINGSLKTGTVDDATFAPTSTIFETDITTNSDEFTKQTILWTGGLNAGMFVRVLSYAFANSKVKLTLSEDLPNVPVDGDTFAVTSRIE